MSLRLPRSFLVRFWVRGLEFSGFRRRRSLFSTSCWERRACVWTFVRSFSCARPLVCGWSGRWLGILSLSEGVVAVLHHVQSLSDLFPRIVSCPVPWAFLCCTIWGAYYSSRTDILEPPYYMKGRGGFKVLRRTFWCQEGM